jgi:hypothetical protein
MVPKECVLKYWPLDLEAMVPKECVLKYWPLEAMDSTECLLKYRLLDYGFKRVLTKILAIGTTGMCNFTVMILFNNIKDTLCLYYFENCSTNVVKRSIYSIGTVFLKTTNILL